MSDEENQINKLRSELADLKAQFVEKEVRLTELLKKRNSKIDSTYHECKLSNNEIARYSRQVILPQFGVDCQMKLKNSSMLIIGMGGLGCPAAEYLVAAGCGRLGLVDYDNVELSNLHRQTLHRETCIGMKKVQSAFLTLKSLNANCRIDEIFAFLSRENAISIIEPYDIILDCSDNVPTRYLLNDVCVRLGKPLVSGSALQYEGQLTVYNYNESSPCYRCLYPVPPPPAAVTNCGDAGILGAITGVIGCLQAIEAIKIAVGGLGDGVILSGRLLIYDGITCTFRNVRLRNRNPKCAACSDKPIIPNDFNYESFCGMRASDKDYTLNILPAHYRMTALEFKDLQQNKCYLLIDVRQTSEYDLCHIPDSKNIPLKNILDDSFIDSCSKELNNPNLTIVVVCRRGNDSQIAVQHMLNKFPQHIIRDIKGGLYAYNQFVDKNFPIY